MLRTNLALWSTKTECGLEQSECFNLVNLPAPALAECRELGRNKTLLSSSFRGEGLGEDRIETVLQGTELSMKSAQDDQFGLQMFMVRVKALVIQGVRWH